MPEPQDQVPDEAEEVVATPLDEASTTEAEEGIATVIDEPTAAEADPEVDGATDDTEAVRGPLHLDFAGKSHVGLIRKNNQDSGYASATMLLVADGMGGAAAGDLASAVAVTTAQQHDRLVIGAGMLDDLSDTVRRANNKIADLVADDHTLEGMGTTVSGGLFDGSRIGVCHIGDSRIYLIRDGELERLTHDHSWVQSLVDDGKITEEEAAFHPHRSLLIKVLNGHPTNVPDTQLVDLREGDRLVLCSDGLCGLVDDAEILDIARTGPLQTTVDDLVEAALQAGGLDNVTVIVADVVATEPDPALDPLVLGAAVDTDIPSLTTPTVDLGDAEAAEDEVDDDTPVRPAAPRPADADDEDRRYAVTTPPRRRWLARLIAGVLAVAVLVGLGAGTWAWCRTQYYVGAADDKVAIFQGLPQNVLGVQLSSVYQIHADVLLRDLPTLYRDRVLKTISANSLAEAENTVNELKQFAQDCRDRREHPTPPPTTAPPSGPATPAPPGTPGTPGTPGSPATPGQPGSPHATAPGSTVPETPASSPPPASPTTTLPPSADGCG